MPAYLQEVLQRKAVHHDAEHAHVVSAGTVHPPALELGPPEEVATTHHHGHLDARAGRFGNLGGNPAHDVRVEPDLATAEGLPGKLEQHPLVCRVRGFRGHGASQGRYKRYVA